MIDILFCDVDHVRKSLNLGIYYIPYESENALTVQLPSEVVSLDIVAGRQACMLPVWNNHTHIDCHFSIITQTHYIQRPGESLNL
jgi:hypothetical protein